jgi:hypothetical protein
MTQTISLPPLSAKWYLIVVDVSYIDPRFDSVADCRWNMETLSAVVVLISFVLYLNSIIAASENGVAANDIQAQSVYLPSILVITAGWRTMEIKRLSQRHLCWCH